MADRQTKRAQTVSPLEDFLAMCPGVHAEMAPRGKALMDECPTRIKTEGHGKSANADEDVLCISPSSTEETSEVVAHLNDRRLPFVVVGARSNVVGSFADAPPVALLTERLSSVRSFDPVSQLVTVGAGTNGGELERWLEDRGFTLGQYPQSLYMSSVGGWLNTRATGSVSALHGGIEHAIKGATIVLPSGQILPFSPKARPGGGIDGLGTFIGSEGSLGVVTEVSLEVHRKRAQRFSCFLFGNLAANIEAQRELAQGGYPIALLRGYNAFESEHILGDISGGQCLLLASTEGPDALLERQHEAIAECLVSLGGKRLADDAADRWFSERYKVETMMTSRNATEGKAFDTIEVSVPWSSATACAAEMELAMQELSSPFYLHFSHAYTVGVCFYSILWVTAEDEKAVMIKLKRTWATALEIVAKHGGTIGHHHGVGAIRSEAYGTLADATVHRAMKAALDPNGVLYGRLLQ